MITCFPGMIHVIAIVPENRKSGAAGIEVVEKEPCSPMGRVINHDSPKATKMGIVAGDFVFFPSGGVQTLFQADDGAHCAFHEDNGIIACKPADLPFKVRDASINKPSKIVKPTMDENGINIPFNRG